MKLQKKVIDKDGRPTSDKIYNIEECLDKIPKISEIENRTSAIEGKLNGIEAGAEVNQNAFSNVKVGPTIIEADSKKDTLELVAGSNITLTSDAPNDKITIATTDTATFSNLATTNLTTINLTTNGEIEVYGTELQKQPHIDFHYSGSTEDKTSRIIETTSGQLDLQAGSGVLINGKKTKNEDQSENFTVHSSRIANFSCTAKYNELLGVIFVRIYGTINVEMTAGYGYVIVDIPEAYKPSYKTALSVKVGANDNQITKKYAAAYATSSGIIIQPLTDSINSYGVYIAGFWFA